MNNSYLIILSLIIITCGVSFFFCISIMELIPKIKKLILKIKNSILVGGVDKMNNIDVKKAYRKNLKNIIILGVIGIIMACAAFGLAIAFLVNQINLAHTLQTSIGNAIGIFIGMLIGIIIFVVIGSLLFSNAVRRLYIQETTYNIIKENKNGRSK